MQLDAFRDSTLFDSGAGDIANGSGEFLLSGGEGSDESARRGLISFDINNSGIPIGATILDVTMSLNLSFSIGGVANISLHRVTNAWGEGSSDAIGDEIDGAPAEAQDATWLYRFFNSSLWNNPGGDFTGDSSADVNVGAAGTYQWSDERMVADVQQWLDDPGSDFGWMLLSESVPGSIKGFHSRDSSNAALRPSLEITYEEPILPTLIAGRTWNDADGNGLRVPQNVRDLGLHFHLQRDYFNSYGGGEFWFRSSSDNGWYFFTSDGNLTKWDKTPGQLTGTIFAELPARFYLSGNHHLLVDAAGVQESWINGVTIELLDQFGMVAQTTVTADFDVNEDGSIDPETEVGWYQFAQVPEGSYRIRQVVSGQRTESAGQHSALSKYVFDLDSQLNLRFFQNLFENFGGLHERWVLGDNGWHYITPDGGFYHWNRVGVSDLNPLTGTLVVQLTSAYYRDPSLIYAAMDPLLQAVDGTVINGQDFGSFQSISISGRVWHDRNGDGSASPQSYLTVNAINSPPSTGPASAVYWYQAAQSNGSTESEFYFVDANSNLFAWSETEGSVFLTQLWGGFEHSSQVFLDVGFIAEPYQNGWTVELVDLSGRVVASTVSADLDRDGDQQISPSTERGWYTFSGVLPGTYFVRQVATDGWVRTTQPDIGQYSLLNSLQQTQGFKHGAADWYNFGFRNERWFQNQSGAWYFITPDGSVYDWDRNSGGAKGVANGTLIARFSSGYYLNLSLLVNPVNGALHATAGSLLDGGDFGNYRIVDGLFAEIADDLLSG